MDKIEFNEYMEHLLGGRGCATRWSAGEDNCGPPGTCSPEESTLPGQGLGAKWDNYTFPASSPLSRVNRMHAAEPGTGACLWNLSAPSLQVGGDPTKPQLPSGGVHSAEVASTLPDSRAPALSTQALVGRGALEP